MEHWNPTGWSLLFGGFLFGMIAGWMQAGEPLSLVPYAAILAGLTILVTNMLRTLWRFIRSLNVIRDRLQI
jgi:hypothetical protein